jgi:hypothetical protein
LTSVSMEKRPWRFEDFIAPDKRTRIERRTEFFKIGNRLTPDQKIEDSILWKPAVTKQ